MCVACMYIAVCLPEYVHVHVCVRVRVCVCINYVCGFIALHIVISRSVVV